MDLLLLAGLGAAAYFVLSNAGGSDASAPSISSDGSLDVTGKIQAIAQAIAQAEGFGVAGKIPTLANNPGDLELGDIGYGKMGEGITVFGSVTDGWNALYGQISGWLLGTSSNYSINMTWDQIGAKYAGASAWANNVASALGVDPNSTLGAYLSS